MSKIIRTERVVERRGDRQYLIERHCIRGLVLCKRTIDEEVIPGHVLISLGCFGDTGGWRSKFAEYINK